MGHLIEFDGTVARIYKIASLCNQAKITCPTSKQLSGFKCEVQVSLELATPTQTKTASR